MFSDSQILAAGLAAAEGARVGLRDNEVFDQPVQFTGSYAILGVVVGGALTNGADTLPVAPRLVVQLDFTVPGAGYSEWVGTDATGAFLSDEDLHEFL